MRSVTFCPEKPCEKRDEPRTSLVQGLGSSPLSPTPGDAASARTTGPGVSSGGSSSTFDGDQSVSSSYAYALTNGSYNLHAFMGSITDSGTYSESNSSSYSSSSHSVGSTSSSSGAGAV